MKNVAAIFILLCSAVPSDAQQMLSLDSCRAMALRNNKQINIARLKKDVATNTRKAARTKYLPHIDVLGGYEFMSKEISILNNEQKGVLGSLGTTAAGELGNTMSSAITDGKPGRDITADRRSPWQHSRKTCTWNTECWQCHRQIHQRCFQNRHT